MRSADAQELFSCLVQFTLYESEAINSEFELTYLDT